MKLSFSLVLLLLIGILAIGCERGDGSSTDAEDVQIEISVTPDPPQVGPATITVTLTDADGEPITGADLDIEGTMSHAGMEPVLSNTTGDETGQYVTDDFEFTMGGDWIIIVRGELPDGTEIEREIDLAGVEG